MVVSGFSKLFDLFKPPKKESHQQRIIINYLYLFFKVVLLIIKISCYHDFQWSKKKMQTWIDLPILFFGLVVLNKKAKQNANLITLNIIMKI